MKKKAIKSFIKKIKAGWRKADEFILGPNNKAIGKEIKYKMRQIKNLEKEIAKYDRKKLWSESHRLRLRYKKLKKYSKRWDE